MMSKILDITPGGVVTHQEKRAWIMLVVSTVAYGVYAGIILSRADGQPLPQVPYAATLLWTIGASILASKCWAGSARLEPTGKISPALSIRPSIPPRPERVCVALLPITTGVSRPPSTAR